MIASAMSEMLPPHLASTRTGWILRVERGTGHADAVVGQRRHGAGHVRAMPAGVGTDDLAAFAGAVPVALVGRIGIAAVAIACRGGVADEVVTGDHVAVEVAVAGDAGVEHRHHHAGAGGAVPGLVGTDAGIGILIAPLLGIARVVGRQRRLQQAIDLDVLDVRDRRPVAASAVSASTRSSLRSVRTTSAPTARRRRCCSATPSGPRLRHRASASCVAALTRSALPSRYLTMKRSCVGADARPLRSTRSAAEAGTREDDRITAVAAANACKRMRRDFD